MIDTTNPNPDNTQNGCISIIIPTYNRSYCLKKTLKSYIKANSVAEIIIVNDGSTDNTPEVVLQLSSELNNQCKIRVITHKNRKGALRAKESGAKESSCPYILFGEDDVIIEPNYPEKLLHKIVDTGCSYASGRIIYLDDCESTENAKSRFGFGSSTIPYIDTKRIAFNLEALVTKDVEIPFSHALYMTKRDIALEIGYDDHYSIGTGYREETDSQLQGYFSGYKHILVHDAFCFHLPFSFAHRGGQRTNRISHIYYNIKLNNYFLRKNHSRLNSMISLQRGKYTMIFSNAAGQIYYLLVRKLIVMTRHKMIRLIRKITSLLDRSYDGQPPAN